MGSHGDARCLSGAWRRQLSQGLPAACQAAKKERQGTADASFWGAPEDSQSHWGLSKGSPVQVRQDLQRAGH